MNIGSYPMMLQPLNFDPRGAWVLQGVSCQAHFFRHGLATLVGEFIQPRFEFLERIRMIFMGRLRPDQPFELEALGSYCLFHYVSGLLLRVNLAAVRDRRAIEEISGIIG